MKKLSIILVLLIAFSACSDRGGNLLITGEVKGLKKGTLYLQKIEDTSLVTIDSVEVQGDPSFTFDVDLESPQVLYLYLDKVDATDFNDRLLFFAEPGEMTVTTSLDKFETDAVVEGSVNQEKLAEYRKMMDRFNSQNLDLLKTKLQAQQQENEELVRTTDEQFDNLIRRRYLYTVNYALNNKDYEVAPYLAVSEIFDANIKYLDTIYTSLTPKIKESKYGKSLEAFLEERRNNEAGEEIEPEGVPASDL